MNAKERKEHPLYSGVLKYFPKALMAVAHCSWRGNEQHNPGEPLYWNRAKSTDEPDALMRHLLEAGTLDDDGIRHSTKVAWRALAMLEKELEAAQGVSPHDQLGADYAALFIKETQRAEKEKAPAPEGERAYGEAIGTWVPGAATPRQPWPSCGDARCQDPRHQSPSPEAQTFALDSARLARLESVHPLPSNLREYLEAASQGSPQEQLDAARLVASTLSRPSSHPASEPELDGESLGDA